jgi:hypothetical protein
MLGPRPEKAKGVYRLVDPVFLDEAGAAFPHSTHFRYAAGNQLAASPRQYKREKLILTDSSSCF